MSQLSPLLRHAQDNTLIFMCPGCKFPHQVKVGEGEGPRWGYNQDPFKPTFTPSLLVRRTYGEDQQEQVCHSFITDGSIQFLSDCTHELANKNVLIPDWPGENRHVS